MSLQSVACFDLSDGDRAFLYWNTETQKFQLTSDQDQNFEECTFRDVRRTIYWAMGGNDPYTCDLPLVIHGLVRKHNELLHDGEPWEEYCSESVNDRNRQGATGSPRNARKDATRSRI